MHAESWPGDAFILVSLFNKLNQMMTFPLTLFQSSRKAEIVRMRNNTSHYSNKCDEKLRKTSRNMKSSDLRAISQDSGSEDEEILIHMMKKNSQGLIDLTKEYLTEPEETEELN